MDLTILFKSTQVSSKSTQKYANLHIKAISKDGSQIKKPPD